MSALDTTMAMADRPITDPLFMPQSEMPAPVGLPPLTQSEVVGTSLCRIVPSDPPAPGGYCMAQGSKVLLPNGQAVPGVTGITLRAGVNDLWRATIEVNVQPPRVDVAPVFVYGKPWPYWRRALMRIAGARTMDHTTFDSRFREPEPIKAWPISNIQDWWAKRG